MVEFIVSLIVTVLSLSVYHWYVARTPVDKKMTWGEAMVAALYVFYVFFWIYGVVPHYWLEWADKGLGWRADVNFELFGILRSQSAGGWFPFNIPMIVLRDIIAVLIHVVFLAANIWYWNHWQTRAARAQAKEQVVETPSEFGRPLIREGAR
ncbi:MAG: hypothetical protein ACI81L_001348 [Verrucomicrobiales bacterium]|jgi:hypothetical protein